MTRPDMTDQSITNSNLQIETGHSTPHLYYTVSIRRRKLSGKSLEMSYKEEEVSIIDRRKFYYR